MKNLKSRYITGSFLLLAFCNCAYAQTSKLSNDISLASSKEVAYNDDAKEPTNIAALNAVTLASINSKAVKDFTRSYKTHANANWFTTNDGWVAVYSQDAVKTRVYYNQKGRLLGDIRTYGEETLPKDIRHQVKSTYYDFNIFLVNEINVGDQQIFLVKIEDKTSFKTIRVENGEMMETEAFTKSK